MFRGILRMPNSHPTASTLTTGILAALHSMLLPLAIISLILGRFTVLTQEQIPQDIIGGSISFCFLALTIYAIYDTNWLRTWELTTSGRYKHPIVRWAGPIYLLVFASFMIIVLLIFGAAEAALGSNDK